MIANMCNDVSVELMLAPRRWWAKAIRGVFAVFTGEVAIEPPVQVRLFERAGNGDILRLRAETYAEGTVMSRSITSDLEQMSADAVVEKWANDSRARRV